MKFTPHEYQQRGMALLYSNYGAGLLLDPGLGKTSIVLGTFTHLLDEAPATRMLIVAPIKPAYDTWPREIEKWDDFNHITYQILHGAAKDANLRCAADIHIVNPEGLAWLLAHPDMPKYDILCIDESTRFKNTSSKRFKALRGRLQDFSRRWILTGTVVPNGLIDLFGQAYIMDMGASLGSSVTQYKGCYFYEEGYGGYTLRPRPGALEVISDRIEDIVLCLSAEDELDMPKLMKIERFCELPKAAMSTYKKVEEDFIVELGDDTLVAANAAVAGNKCRQIANGQVYVYTEDDLRITHKIHAEKFVEFQSLVEELNGHSILVFYEFQHDKDRILTMLGDSALCITGLTGTRLNMALRKFNEGNLPVLLAHPGSVHGLNIQEGCHHMIWFGLPWNLEHYLQAVWRLYRQGQSSTIVYCYHILGRNTLDATVSKVLLSKEATQEKLEAALRAKDDSNV